MWWIVKIYFFHRTGNITKKFFSHLNCEKNFNTEIPRHSKGAKGFLYMWPSKGQSMYHEHVTSDSMTPPTMLVVSQLGLYRKVAYPFYQYCDVTWDCHKMSEIYQLDAMPHQKKKDTKVENKSSKWVANLCLS